MEPSSQPAHPDRLEAARHRARHVRPQPPGFARHLQKQRCTCAPGALAPAKPIESAPCGERPKCVLPLVAGRDGLRWLLIARYRPCHPTGLDARPGGGRGERTLEHEGLKMSRRMADPPGTWASITVCALKGLGACQHRRPGPLRPRDSRGSFEAEILRRHPCHVHGAILAPREPVVALEVRHNVRRGGVGGRQRGVRCGRCRR